MKKKKNGSLLERIGKKLPEVNIIFLYLILITMVLSFVLSIFGDNGQYAFGDIGSVTINNMFSSEGFRWIMDNLVHNFITFAPLGIVLAIVIGTGVAEQSGLLGTVLKKLGLLVPDKFLIPSIIFLGVMSSIASDAGYVVLVPLAGALFVKLGKNPIIGMAAAFAGVSAGFGANLLPTPGDALLGAITNDVATSNSIPLDMNIVTMNYFFMIASTFLLVIVGTFVTYKFVVPKFKDREFIVPKELESNDMTTMTPMESKGLRAAGIALIVTILILIVLGFTWLAPYELANELGEVKNKIPLLDNIIVVMIILFLTPGYAYGVATGKIKSSSDYVRMTVEAMKGMSYIIVLAFFAGNFIGIFNYTGIANFVALGGAEFLISSGLSTYPLLLLVAFIFVSGFINLFIGSASAKWLILAPVFIPMLYDANQSLSPEVIQVAYRVADSSTNIITPLMSYAGIVILFGKKYMPDFNYGTLVEMMYPYSFSFLIIWSAFLVLWISIGFPLGF